MRKPYEAPAVVKNGSVVQETRTAASGEPEFIGKKANAGSIGFNL
ncbi:MAG: hypothetical protein ACREOQ_14555 [Gemmatimonadales bacterium]